MLKSIYVYKPVSDMCIRGTKGVSGLCSQMCGWRRAYASHKIPVRFMKRVHWPVLFCIDLE